MSYTVHYHITTRTGGFSRGPFASLNMAYHVGDDPQAVSANRHLIATRLHFAPDHIIWMDQTHSTNLATITTACTHPITDTDGLITTQPGLALAVMTADCVPILLADSHCHVIGALHAGRAGAVGGIVSQALEQMYHNGAHPEHLHVLLGPAISPQHYRLPDDLVRQVEHHLPGSQSHTQDGHPSVDLRAGIATQLRHHGIDHIHCDPRCTYDDPDLFSYRQSSTTGRFASLIWLAHH